MPIASTTAPAGSSASRSRPRISRRWASAIASNTSMRRTWPIRNITVKEFIWSVSFEKRFTGLALVRAHGPPIRVREGDPMRFMARVRRELRFLRGLIRTLSRVRSIAPDSPRLICDDIEAAVDAFRTRPAITLGPRTISYGELDELANRFAHWAIEHGVRRGQTIALYAPTRIDYLPIWYGLSKIGAATALINNNLTGAPLVHCLEIAGATLAIVDGETARPLLAVNQSLERPMTVWTLGSAGGELRDLTQALRSCSQLRPDRGVREGLRARDTALFIYTSGTTGLPKAAKINHMRAQLYMRAFAGATDARPDDRIYVTLPLYHATVGLCAMGAALMSGGSAVIRPRFSASHFWSDVAKENCTMFVYIGELCRYLVNQPEQAGEQTHKIRL